MAQVKACLELAREGKEYLPAAPRIVTDQAASPPAKQPHICAYLPCSKLRTHHGRFTYVCPLERYIVEHSNKSIRKLIISQCQAAARLCHEKHLMVGRGRMTRGSCSGS